MSPEARKLAVKCKTVEAHEAGKLIKKLIDDKNQDLAMEVLSLLDNLPIASFEAILSYDSSIENLYWRG